MAEFQTAGKERRLFRTAGILFIIIAASTIVLRLLTDILLYNYGAGTLAQLTGGTLGFTALLYIFYDIADAALVSLNDYYAALANEYSSVYYVDAPDAEIFYPEGTSLVDIVKDIKGFLKNAHPNHNGHVYLADRVLDELMSLNTVCRHAHTKNVCETKQLACGVELVSTEYCTDCGAVIHWGKVVTPYATYTTPSYTITNAVSTVFGNIHKVVGRIFNGLTMAYTK